MTYYVAGIPYSSNDIYHHGIKGQRWGVRRSPQQLGYDVGAKIQNGINKVMHPFQKVYETGQAAKAKVDQTKQKLQSEEVRNKIKTGVKVGAALAVAGLAAYGGYKLSKVINEGNKGYLTDLRFDDAGKINRAYDSLRKDALKKHNSIFNRNKSNDGIQRQLATINDSHHRALNDLKADISKAAKNTKFRDKVSNARKYYKNKGAHLSLDYI